MNHLVFVMREPEVLSDAELVERCRASDQGALVFRPSDGYGHHHDGRWLAPATDPDSRSRRQRG